MSREKKVRRIIGIVLSIICIGLSFFPVIRFLPSGAQTIFQLMKNEQFMNLPLALGPIIIGCSLIVPVVYVYNCILWILNKDGVGIDYIIPTILAISVSMYVPVLAMMICPVEFMPSNPLTMWVAIRGVVACVEIVNRSSGEELFKVLFSKK